MAARLTLMAIVAASGCDSAARTARPGDAASPPRPELATKHDPAGCGTVTGRVHWHGPTPEVPNLLGALPDGDGYAWVTKPNPFTPRVGPDGGLAHALVWLDGVDPATSKPWDIPPVQVDIQDGEFQSQGVSFVSGVARTGEAMTVTSRDAAFYSLRGRGAAVFALPFPARDAVVTRRLMRPGLVELTSATTAYWLAADLLVHDTPYAAVTDTHGRYRMDSVPAGEYTLHMRVRNWHVSRTERDPESGLHARQYYGRPVVRSQVAAVKAGIMADHSARFTATDFLPSE